MAEIDYRDESDVKKQIKKLLDHYGWFWWMPPANGFGKSGISDFNAIHNGVFLVIEAKFDRRKATPAQIGYVNSVRQEGGFGFYVNERRIKPLGVWLAAFEKATAAEAAGEEVPPETGAAMLDMLAILMQEPPC